MEQELPIQVNNTIKSLSTTCVNNMKKQNWEIIWEQRWGNYRKEVFIEYFHFGQRIEKGIIKETVFKDSKEGSLDISIQIRAIPRKNSKGAELGEFKEVSIDISLLISVMVRKRKKTNQTKPERFLKRKATRNIKEKGVGEEVKTGKKHED